MIRQIVHIVVGLALVVGPPVVLGQSEAQVRETQQVADRARQMLDDAQRHEGDLQRQVADQERLNAVLRQRLQEAGGAPSDLANVSAQAAALRKDLDAARARREQAAQKYDEARAQAIARFEQGTDFMAAQKSVENAGVQFDRVSAPILERLASTIHYQEAQALVDAAAQTGESLQMFEGTDSDSQAQADEAFDAALSQLRGLEDAAVDADPTARQARQTLKESQQKLQDLQQDYGKKLADEPAVAEAQKAMDADEARMADLTAELADAEKNLSALRQNDSEPGNNAADQNAIALREGESRLRDLNDQYDQARASREAAADRLRTAEDAVRSAQTAMAQPLPGPVDNNVIPPYVPRSQLPSIDPPVADNNAYGQSNGSYGQPNYGQQQPVPAEPQPDYYGGVYGSTNYYDRYDRMAYEGYDYAPATVYVPTPVYTPYYEPVYYPTQSVYISSIWVNNYYCRPSGWNSWYRPHSWGGYHGGYDRFRRGGDHFTIAYNHNRNSYGGSRYADSRYADRLDSNWWRRNETIRDRDSFSRAQRGYTYFSERDRPSSTGHSTAWTRNRDAASNLDHARQSTLASERDYRYRSAVSSNTTAGRIAAQEASLRTSRYEDQLRTRRVEEARRSTAAAETLSRGTSSYGTSAAGTAGARTVSGRTIAARTEPGSVVYQPTSARPRYTGATAVSGRTVDPTPTLPRAGSPAVTPTPTPSASSHGRGSSTTGARSELPSTYRPPSSGSVPAPSTPYSGGRTSAPMVSPREIPAGSTPAASSGRSGRVLTIPNPPPVAPTPSSGRSTRVGRDTPAPAISTPPRPAPTISTPSRPAPTISTPPRPAPTVSAPPRPSMTPTPATPSPRYTPGSSGRSTGTMREIPPALPRNMPSDSGRSTRGPSTSLPPMESRRPSMTPSPAPMPSVDSGRSSRVVREAPVVRPPSPSVSAPPVFRSPTPSVGRSPAPVSAPPTVRSPSPSPGGPRVVSGATMGSRGGRSDSDSGSRRR